ncbi:MAG: hypothetical protein Lokiarch_39300 [Candidatus Lokiarchaeum sp. GC14_75]|nr:MAG: hypothetical protein Lokiarch_39300 [Candidatus Lokiarchaeum sp. GC14_75]
MTMKNYFERKNIFDLIDIIKERTSMFIPDKSINSLSTYLAGYDSCLELHSIVEKGVPLFKHFGEWLKIKFNWNLSYGWAQAIAENIEKQQDPLKKFYSFVNEFRKLQPEVVSTIQENADEHPSLSLQKIQVIQYFPHNLFFLRFFYAEKHEDDRDLFYSIEEAEKSVSKNKRKG